MPAINLSHLLGATRHSFAGLCRVWREQAFRHEVLVLGLILLLLAVLRPGPGWSLALLSGWLLVLAVELLNTAIEEICNLVSPEYNIRVKHAKDMGSAAIFVTLCLNGLLWLGFLWSLA